MVVATRRWRTLACAVLAWGFGSAAYGTACIFSPKAGAPTVAQLQDGNEVVPLSGARLFDSCARVVVTKGVAIAQYVTDKGDAEREEIAEGQRVNASRLGNAAIAAATKTVGRGILAVLTEPKPNKTQGAKYFDQPGQLGTPFGDVYIPVDGLVVRFVHLEGDARVQIADAASRAVLAEAVAAQGLTLERARFRPGRYTVKVASTRAAPPPGAFEVVAADTSADLDKALQAIDADTRLDATGRAVARALLFEREGLSFNREITLREFRP
jgi:hypothetical protein